MNKISFSLMVLIFACAAMCQEAPIGSQADMKKGEEKALESLRGTIDGHIAWSTSRVNSKHDIWMMNADGTDKRAVTTSPNNVDWFPRFSPDGQKLLITRSKMGWVKEMDADIADKWDLWNISLADSSEEKIVENATWGSWRPSGDSIVFARGAKVMIMDVEEKKQEQIFDAEEFFGKNNVYSQQPQLSPNGKLLAITIRGTVRQTGIYNRDSKKWYTTGEGCQITWFPDNSSVLRMNEGQGNMGTEVLRIPVNEEGEPTVRVSGFSIPKKIRFMDLPGRRSHEYFPQLDNSGQWMVWAATQYGHEHDIADYELYLWNINTNKKKDFVRVTFNTGNDRWPDIFIKNVHAEQETPRQ